MNTENTNDWQIELRGDIVTAMSGDSVGRLRFSPSWNGLIAGRFIPRKELPDVYYEVGGFHSEEIEPVTPAQVRSFASEVFGFMFRLSDCAPLVFACGKRHALTYLRILPECGFGVTIIKGSLCDGEKFAYDVPNVDGTDDDQIICVELM